MDLTDDQFVSILRAMIAGRSPAGLFHRARLEAIFRGEEPPAWETFEAAKQRND